jgi:hypothetical protein
MLDVKNPLDSFESAHYSDGCMLSCRYGINANMKDVLPKSLKIFMAIVGRLGHQSLVGVKIAYSQMYKLTRRHKLH